MMTSMSTLELKVPPIAVTLLAAAAMWLVSLATPSFSLPMFHRGILALFFAFAGSTSVSLGVLAFRKARTTLDPENPGAASSLVSEGIYNLTRNPIYLGFLLLLIGLGVFLANAISLLFIPVFVVYMNRFQILPEERALASAFGQAFVKYTERVRRWI
jgi:protein-S-isoprenylcysteine O-methyltransferase Ste14